jgi:hypothetical protein
MSVTLTAIPFAVSVRVTKSMNLMVTYPAIDLVTVATMLKKTFGTKNLAFALTALIFTLTTRLTHTH